jgi:hypothetical protein
VDEVEECERDIVEIAMKKLDVDRGNTSLSNSNQSQSMPTLGLYLLIK